MRRALYGLPPFVKVVLIMFLIALAVIVVASITEGRTGVGPKQPIPFSHRVHAGSKNISCFFCHPTATVSKNASIPPVQKCFLCHQVIASNFRPIRNMLGYYARQEPIPWIRVNRVPDFVHFSHQPHLARGFDCSRCHGNVKNMDRIRQQYQMNMQFCVTCHWNNKFSVSCSTCHY